MSMIKTGEIRPTVTPDTEQRLDKTAKSDVRDQIRKLDDDPAKRLSDRLAAKLK